jgi:hypothetical protein
MKLTNEKLLDLLNRVDSALADTSDDLYNLGGMDGVCGDGCVMPLYSLRSEADKLEELRREVADAAFTLEREPC